MERPNRHSIRLRHFDYSIPGAYFVTICIQKRECLLGQIKEGQVYMSSAGSMVEAWWAELPRKYPEARIDAHITMPNHVHGIILLGEQAPGEPLTLPKAVHWFKTMTTNAYLRGIKQEGWTPFSGRLWQRGYFERVIRSADELHAIREYILLNPIRWERDVENPHRHVSPRAAT